MWPVNLFFNVTLITIGMYVTNLGYLEDKFLYFTKLSNGNIEELDKILVGLDIAAIISETDN